MNKSSASCCKSGGIGKNPFAQKLLAEGRSKQEILRTVKENLPVTSYAVLQHLAYKYGNGGIKRFTKGGNV